MPAMSDDSVALSILRLAWERGLLTGETALNLGAGESSKDTTATQLRPSQLLSDLLAQGKLTLDDVRAFREEASAALVTQNGNEAAPSAPLASPVDAPTPPPQDRYEIENLIGQGGMGRVYKARDIKLNRVVALKFLHVSDDGTAQRLFREARAQARITHPSVCQVYDVGQRAGQLYIAMEYHAGESLRQLQPKLSLEEKVILVRQVAEALQAAHRIGVIHRDVKSSNILATKTDKESWRAVLLDFGLARDLEASEHMTRTGAVLGTPAYMSPEQVRGEQTQIDRRTDIYSTGVVLYELLTGVLPFTGDLQLISSKILRDEVVPPRRLDPHIPVDLETIALACLQKEPHRRYESAQALADDLGRYLDGQPILARQVSRAFRARRFLLRHWAPVSITALAFLSAVSLAGISIRERRQADQRARLAQQLGREVELSDMFLRMAYSLPIHDLKQEESIVRERVARITQRLAGMPPREASLAHYAIGRSLLMLRDYDGAIEHLQSALAQGQQDPGTEPEIEQMLGRALGARYHQAESQLDTWSLDDWTTNQQARLREQYLAPAKVHLERGSNAQRGEALLNQALLSLYREDFAQAQSTAQQILTEEPWRTEARKILGDVQAAIAHQHRQHGRFKEARQSLRLAQEHYQAALARSRSDYTYLVDAALLQLNGMSLDMYLGDSPAATFEQCMALLRQLQQLRSESVDAPAIRSKAAVFMIRYLNDHGGDSRSHEQQSLNDIDFVMKHEPNYPNFLNTQSLLYMLMIESRILKGQPLGDLPSRMEAAAQQALAKQENPARSYQILGDLYALLSYEKDIHNIDIKEFAEKSLATYLQGIKLHPSRESLYEPALRVFRKFIFPIDMQSGLKQDWLSEAETVAVRGIGIAKNPQILHHFIGGVYLDTAQVRLDLAEDAQVTDLLEKAARHIAKSIELVPAHAPSHADLASLYRLQALVAMRDGTAQGQLLEAAHAAMQHSLTLSPWDSLTRLAHARLLLVSAESERRAHRPIEKLVAELEQTLTKAHFFGWQAAAAALLRAEGKELLARAQTGARRTALRKESLAAVDTALALRPRWLLAQKRKMQLGAALMPDARPTQVLKRGG